MNNTDYCSIRCTGFRCSQYRSGECTRVFSTIKDHDGNVIYRVPPTVQLMDGIENTEEVQMETYKFMEKVGYIPKKKVIEILATKYDQEIPNSTLKYYGSKKLIEPGIKASLPGVTGSVSFYKKDTPKIIASIRY